MAAEILPLDPFSRTSPLANPGRTRIPRLVSATPLANPDRIRIPRVAAASPRATALRRVA